jgi:hypothetical protein
MLVGINNDKSHEDAVDERQIQICLSFIFLVIIFYSRVCVRVKRPIQLANNVRSQVDQPIM